MVDATHGCTVTSRQTQKWHRGREIAVRSIFESRVSALLVAIAITCFGLFLASTVSSNITRSQLFEEREQISEDTFQMISAIERRVAFHEFVSVAISTALALDSNLDQETFSALASPFVESGAGIVNLALETEWQVTHVHPLEQNRRILSLDYREHPMFGKAIAAIRKTSQPILTGPFTLLQGGEGLIYRFPIELGGATEGETPRQGSVAIVSTVESLLAVVQDLSDDVRVAFSFEGTAGSDAATRFGADIKDADEPITRTTEIAGQTITIHAIPKNGWGTETTTNEVVYIVALFLTTTLIALMYWAQAILKSRRESWQQLSDAIESIDDGFALYDPDDRLVLCNSKYKSFYNLSSHLMVPGARFADIVWGGVLAGQYKDAIGREEEWFEERMRTHRNPIKSVEQRLNDDRWLKVSETKLDDGSRVGFRVDISSLKRAQHEAESANRAKMDFLNVMSHEIRTPLSAIIGFSNVLKHASDLPTVKALDLDDRNSADPKKAQMKSIIETFEDYAGRIDVNGQHLLNIINDILYWNDLDNADRPLNVTNIAVSDIVDATVQQLSGLADCKGLSLHAEDSDARVFGDRIRLQQVLVNLVGNAIKFTERGTVSIKIATLENHVRISVADTGFGIPEDQHAKIFESFFQVDSGLNRRFDGSGLGLAISKDIVEKHAGTLFVESVLGQGTTFHVDLPRPHASALAA